MHVFHRFLVLLSILSTVRCATSPLTGFQALLREPNYHVRSLLPTSRTSLSTTSRGLTFDDCRDSGDCVGGRLCFRVVDDDLRLCAGEDDCVCGPRNALLVPCVDGTPCDEGELCTTDGKRYPSCRSEDFIRRNGFTVITSPPGDGYTRDLCRDSSECRDDRTCMFSTDVSEPCDGRIFCFCLPPNLRLCCPGEECILEEVCAINTGISDRTPFCVSRTNVEMDQVFEEETCGPGPPSTQTPTPSPKPGTSPSTSPTRPQVTKTQEPTFVPTPLVCIAVHLLRHLPDSKLVFRKHAWGTVLCDAGMSCATPGHIIVYKDEPMMMSSYCQLVSCVKRVMQVNSPRYRRKQRIPSMTDGLEFTVFAARYETRLEQHIMRVAVKMGL